MSQPSLQPPSNLIHNERVKLTANALDRASTACLTVGILGPTAAALYGIGSAVPVSSGLIATGAALWLAAAMVLHLLANATLGRLK